MWWSVYLHKLYVTAQSPQVGSNDAECAEGRVCVCVCIASIFNTALMQSAGLLLSCPYQSAETSLTPPGHHCNSSQRERVTSATAPGFF